MKKVLTAICFAVPLLLCAQTPLLTSKKVKKQRTAPQWDTLYFKNELSVDVSPAITFITGAVNDYETFGFTYRHFFTKHDAIRVGTKHGIYKHSFSSGGMYYERYQTDSSNMLSAGDTVGYSRFYQTKQYSPDLRLGYEHRFGKRRFKLMLGIDAIVGLQQDKTIDDERWFLVYTENNAGVTSYYIFNNNDAGFVPFHEKKSLYLKAGISPFVGVQVHLSKRFSLNGSFLTDLTWNIPLQGDDTNAGLNLNSYALASDIGLTVHF